ncbi:MAG: 4Fe-4S dicluster domain-containing protein, partial [Pseudomonadales bacterium]
GMLGAEAVFEAVRSGSTDADIDLQERFESSWLYDELYGSRNAGPALHKFGMFFGSAYSVFEQAFTRGKHPFTLRDKTPDHDTLKPAADCNPIDYPKPDGTLSFDKLSSVFLSSTNHEEDQPCHLTLTDPDIPIRDNLPMYAEPAQLYCPAGVYEVVEENGSPRFQINAQNCVHCKTCDIKDPAQNITWVVPEGTGGPNYPNM